MDHTYPEPAGRRRGSPQVGVAAVASRRTALKAVGLAAVSGAAGVALAGCGSSEEDRETARWVTTRTWSFRSRARGGTRTTCTLVWPGGPSTDDAVSPPVVVALHGLGQDHRILAQLGAPRLLAAHLRAGGAPFALVAPDGGTSYWHPHDGQDAGAMVVDELLPQLPQHAVGIERIGLMGWSMGGYGALRLADLLGPSRVAAVAAVSPALWTDPAGASRSGFDDAAEYERYSVMGDQARLRHIAVRVDCGLSDPFAAAVRAYRSGFTRPPGGGFSAGGHDRAYWRRTLPGQLHFLGSRLAT